MFRSLWIFGWQITFIPHQETVITVVFGKDGPIETTWKKLFDIGQFGLYIKGEIKCKMWNQKKDPDQSTLETKKENH